MVNLFEYLDYREYLRDYYKERKSTSPFFSYRFIGSRVGMDSSYVIKVLQGALHLSRPKVDAFIKLLELSEKEAEYFATLVQFCKAKGERERKVFFDKLFSITTVNAVRLEASQYEFFQKWYYSAVWALIDCKPFEGDYRELAQLCMPSITVWDAKRAVRLLEKLGFVSRGTDKVYRTNALNLTTGQKWFSHAVEQYQREMIRLAGESIERFPKQERDISTVTLSVAESSLPEVQEVVRQFRSTLIKLVNNTTPSDRVYQLNVQLFPLSQGKVGGK